MKKTVIVILTLTVFACSTKLEYSDELKQIAVDVNNKCPKMLDSETRLDGIEIKEPNTLIYKYSLINFNSATADTHLFNLAMWPGILSYVKVSADMKKLREHNTSIFYRYTDKNNKPFYEFKIFPNHYNKK